MLVSLCLVGTSFLFQRLKHVRLRQQWMAAIGKNELLPVMFKDTHVRDAAVEVRHIVRGILGILAVAINLVLMLQQLGVLHSVQIGPLLWRSDGRCLHPQPRKAERVRLTLCLYYQSRQTTQPPRPCR